MWNYCNHCHRSEIIAANYCRDRFCAICAPKKANKIRFQIVKTISDYVNNPRYEWLFLTLTVRNVAGDQLKETVSQCLKATTRFFDRRQIERAVAGYIRSLEITYNQTSNTYHPHIHVLLMVDKESYFKEGEYISQSEWAQFWKESARLNYIPTTDIRKVHQRGKNGTIERAILETAKYPVKLFQIPNATVFFTLDNALKGKQLVSAGGLLRDKWRISEFDKQERCCNNPEITQTLYKWSTTGYKITE